jgi:molecular chaperone DnaK (HSP70)
VATSGRVIGIDFGTSTSFAAEGDVARGVTLAPLGRATTYLPSLLGLAPSGLIAGDDAADLPEGQIVRSIKRCVTQRRESVPSPTGPENPAVTVDDGIVVVLRHLAESVRAVGMELDAETIRLGCPAMWDASQRSRLLRLAREAGIPVQEHTLIDEPIAAGMAWLSHHLRERPAEVKGRLLVFDMGGGTLDVALLQVDSTFGEHSGEISVLSSKGVDEAGDALDQSIRQDLERMWRDLGIDLDTDPPARAEFERLLLSEAREAKVILSSTDKAFVQVAVSGRRLPTLTYTREQLEAAFKAQLDAAERLVWHVVRESFLTHEAHRSPSELRAVPHEEVARGVDRVLLAGGMSQIPAVRERLERMFPRAEVYSSVGSRVKADEAIVAGLAETAVYDRVNLHRPPFDFHLQLPGGNIVPLYKAHSPLYEGWLAMQRDDLYYETFIAPSELPANGRAQLQASSSMGTELAFRVGTQKLSGIEVPLGHKGVRFRIRPNGHISVMDGRGKAHRFRVNRWPVLRGKDHAVIQMERVEGDRVTRRARGWESDPLFLH